MLINSLKKILFTACLLLCAHGCINAQAPDWNRFTNIKERVDTMRKYSINLLRKQQLDEALTVINQSLIFSQQASLDSAISVNFFLLENVYRYKLKFDSAFHFLEKAKAIAIRNKLITLGAAIEIDFYGLYNRTGKMDSANAVAGRLRNILPALDSNSKESAKIEMYLGHYEKHQARYAVALAHYYSALRKFIFLKDSINEGNMYVSLATVLVLRGETERALDYHRQAAALFTILHRPVEQLNELLNIIDLYYTSGRLDPAEAAVKQALPIATQLNDKDGQSYLFLHLGNIYKRRKQFPEAEAWLLKAVGIPEAVKNTDLYMEINQSLGEMYMAQKQFAKAGPYLEKHLAIARQQNIREEIIEASWNLSENEYALHNYAKAYEYKNLYSIYRDSSFLESNAKSMAEMEAKYQAEKKEKEIALLKKDQELNRLSIQKQKNFQAAGIVFLVLLLLIAFLLVNRYRIVQRSKRLIEMEKMRNQIARDLHDDIGSNLTSIHILSKMAGEQAMARGELLTSPSLEKIKDRSAEMMESVGDIVWTINPQNDTLDKLLARMKEFAADIVAPAMHYEFIEAGDFSSVKPGIKLRRDIFLFFKESLNNAVKYSHGSSIIIKLGVQFNQLNLEITDNGVGFDPDRPGTGNGLANLKSRATLMNAALSIQSSAGKGTSIGLKLPLT